jgi:hypothetical protein
MPTRRRFLRDCSVVATVASLTPTAVLAASRRGRTVVSGQPDFEQFAQELNTSFSLRTGLCAPRLLLVEAYRLPATSAKAEDARNERFCLLFRGPAHQPLAQNTYVFEHPHLGDMAIFIVPIGSREGTPHCYYEAVFNYPTRPVDLVAQLSLAPQRARRG